MRKLLAVCWSFWIVSSWALAGPIEQARELIDDGELDRAGAVLERAAVDPRLEASATQLLAELANRQGDYAKGIEWGKKAISADAASSNAQYQYAVALRNKMQAVSQLRAMMSLGDYKKALARAIDLDADNIDARREQIGFFLNAPGIAGGSAEKARALAVELRGRHWRAGTEELAEVERDQKNPAAAMALFEELVARHPDDGQARLRFGYHLQEQESWKAADAQFERVVALDPARASAALYQRARTRILGRYDQEKALGFLDDYLAQVADGEQPSPSAAWWRKGNALEQLGRTDDARHAYEQAVRLDKTNAQAKKALKKLPKG